MNSDRDPGPIADVVNSPPLQSRIRRRSRTESISVSTEPSISTNSGSTTPKIDSPSCFECGRRFRSPKALYGHYRCHPERRWRGSKPPAPHMAEENKKVVDSVKESGGEKEDKKAEEEIMADEKGEDSKTCESIISSCQREDAPLCPNQGIENSATVGETDGIKKGRPCIDLNKLPDEEDDPDSSDSCCILIFGIKIYRRRKVDHWDC